MSDAEPLAQKPASQLTTAPTEPAIADALRALGPDYEQALVDSIAARVDELAREREVRGRTTTPPPTEAHSVPFPQAPPPLPVAAPHPPAPAPPPAPYVPPGPEEHRRESNPALPVSILSLIFGFVITVVALTAGLALDGPTTLIAILVVWIAIVLVNFAAWGSRRPRR